MPIPPNGSGRTAAAAPEHHEGVEHTAADHIADGYTRVPFRAAATEAARSVAAMFP